MFIFNWENNNSEYIKVIGLLSQASERTEKQMGSPAMAN